MQIAGSSCRSFSTSDLAHSNLTLSYYSFLLQEKGQTEAVYMAVSDVVYRNKFRSDAVQVLVRRFGLRLLIVDTESEAIVQWVE